MTKQQYKYAKPLLLSEEDQKLVRDGVKTQFRSVITNIEVTFIEPNYRSIKCKDGNGKGYIYDESDFILDHCKNQISDVFYLQEEFVYIKQADDVLFRDSFFNGFITLNTTYKETDFDWQPASEMPKEHARTFLVTTDVRVERLQDIELLDIAEEGYPDGYEPFYFYTNEEREQYEDKMDKWFIKKWNSTHPEGQKWGDKGIFVEVKTVKVVER